MWTTKKGYDGLLKKLKDLESKKREAFKELGNQAERDSDLPENPIWKQLQVELKIDFPKQISELQKIISQCRIIEDELKDQLNNQDKVRIGSKVKIILDGEEKNVVLVGPYDIDVIPDSVSYLSPLGKTILGSVEGEEKTFMAPKGKRAVTILSIEKGL